MKRRRLRESRLALRGRPINVLASLLTTLNLYCGINSIFACIGREFETAALFIVASIIFDMLDGAVARLTHSTSSFGKELDSLCDIVSFGVAPGVMLFAIYLPGEAYLNEADSAESIIGHGGSFIAILYIICTALRLARYNTYQAGMRGTFVGLPSPAAAGVMASFVLFYEYFEDKPGVWELDPWAYHALWPMTLGLALLMMSTVRYQKNPLRTLVMAPRRAFFTLWIWALIIAFVIHSTLTLNLGLLLFPLGVTYVLSGIGDYLYRRLSRRVSRHEPDPAEEGSVKSGNGRGAHESPSSGGAVKKDVPL